MTTTLSPSGLKHAADSGADGVAALRTTVKDNAVIQNAKNALSVLASQQVLDVGISGQRKAGRSLVAADLTALPTDAKAGLGLASPILLQTPGSLVNLGTGGNLVNKGSVSLTAKGILAASDAALFTGSTGQALYIVDTGAADPFRIKTGTWWCWARTAKRASTQTLLSKNNGAATQGSWSLASLASNFAHASVSFDGTTYTTADGTSDVADDRWHFIVATFDGTALRLYVDGVLETTAYGAGAMFASNAPVNVGGRGADAGTACVAPHFGRIYQPGLLKSVLNEDQIRFLMACSIAHGFPVEPTHIDLSLRRGKRGGPLVTGDFATPASVLRLHNWTAGALTDAGAHNLAVTMAAGTFTSVVGADGQDAGAYQRDASWLQSADTNLPAGTTARTVLCWFKTGTAGTQILVTYGTLAGNAAVSLYLSNGLLIFGDVGGTNIAASTKVFNDGQWHLGVATYDNAPADGLKIKLYCDGVLVASSTATITGTTLAGANAFRIGASLAGASALTGSIDAVAIASYAAAEDEQLSIYNKGSVLLAASPKNAGDNVEAVDATNIYLLGDDLEGCHNVDLLVAA